MRLQSEVGNFRASTSTSFFFEEIPENVQNAIDEFEKALSHKIGVWKKSHSQIPEFYIFGDPQRLKQSNLFLIFLFFFVD